MATTSSQWSSYGLPTNGRTVSERRTVYDGSKGFTLWRSVLFQKIIASSDPGEIKQYGREIRGFREDLWNNNKFQIVVKGNEFKFKQNAYAKQILMGTGTKTIVEASPYDKIWGIGLSATDAKKVPESQWPGQNLLGKALMEVRNRLK